MVSAIDLIGKLAPALVAFAVFLLTRAQNRWVNRMGLRAAEVEDQKLRLALLDRRLIALDAIRDAGGEFMHSGRASAALVGKLRDALRMAELIYEDPEVIAINEVVDMTRRWVTLDTIIEALSKAPGNQEKRMPRLEEQFLIECRIQDAYPDLLKQLVNATRVRAVPPIAPGAVRLRVPYWKSRGHPTPDNPSAAP